MFQKSSINIDEILQNLIAALTVSFAAISLGAAFGLLSGRGAFAGIISAGIIALLASLFGGTRVQCSGPTAPMTAITVLVVAFSANELLVKLPEANPVHFINIVFILTGVLLFLGAVLKLGKFIEIIPNIVVSGFMNGIAILIWIDQIKKLFGIMGKKAYGGPVAINVIVAIVTCTLIFIIPKIAKKIPKGNLLSATLLSIVIMSTFVAIFRIPIETIQLNTRIDSFESIKNIVVTQFPSTLSLDLILLALPFALQLAVLGFLDTLLTSLVVDKLINESTKKNQELAAQGLANTAAAFFGGIPGAQATIRSVLIIKEKATKRYAGVLVGVFVLVEMVLFQDLLNYIPQAVFAGVLLKIGWDVFDKESIIIFINQVKKTSTHSKKFHITNVEMFFFIGGTTLITVVKDLNIAVGIFTLLFFLYNKVFFRNNPLQDMRTGLPT
ncbi:MAG: SulP family inorganic anion transporter [Desulfobacterales bacterium]|nr:SulP family inorganic anion transporter [Desulfobacterales bacterium]